MHFYALTMLTLFTTTAHSFFSKAKPVQFAFCKTDVSSFHLSSITLNPNPPQIGRDVRITVKGDATREIRDNTKIKLSVYLGKLPVYKQTYDLCQEGKAYGVQCPLPVGSDQTISVVMPVLEEIPTWVAVNLHMEMLHEDGETLAFCGDAHVQFTKPSKP